MTDFPNDRIDDERVVEKCEQEELTKLSLFDLVNKIKKNADAIAKLIEEKEL